VSSLTEVYEGDLLHYKYVSGEIIIHNLRGIGNELGNGGH